MGEAKSNRVAKVEPRDIAVRLRADLALRDLPTEEPFPAIHPNWRTYVSFRHINALAAGGGELWAATWGGVVRWRFESQGQRVTFTRFASEHGLPTTRFECVALDLRDHPWVGGPGAGLSTFDGERWHTLTTEDGLPSNDVLCIVRGADGQLWASAKGGLGYVTTDGGTPRWRRRSLDAVELPAEEIRALAVDGDETLWLGTDWGLYQLLSDGSSRRYTVQDGLSCLQVTHLATNGRGRLWVGTAAGLFLQDGDHFVLSEGLEASILGLTAEPGRDILWIVTPEGIGAYTPEGLGAIEPHPALRGEPQGRAVAVDESGHQWLGYTEGVTQEFPARVLLSRDDVDQMTKGENSLCNHVTAIQVDKTGRVWTGTPEGLWFLERNVWRQCQPGIELGAPLANVQAIAQTASELWIGGWREDGPHGGSGSGLRRFIGTTEVPLVGEMPELPYVDALTCGGEGRVWVAAEGIIRRFDGRQWEQLPSLPDEALNEVVQALAVGERDVLWCGTTGGLWRFDGEWHREVADASVQALVSKDTQVWAGTTTGLKHLSGRLRRRWKDVACLSDANVMALTMGGDGTVWVGTTGGLARIEGNDCRVFTVSESGLVNDFVQALGLDGDTLWIGTVNGLSRLNVNDNRQGAS